MHGHEGVIEFRLDLAAFGPFATQQVFEELEVSVRVSQLNTEENGHQSTDDCPDHPRDEELLADHLMIHAEHILRNKSLLMMMNAMLIGMRVMMRYHIRMSMYCCFVAHEKIFILKIHPDPT